MPFNVLVGGQSNALGRATDGPGFDMASARVKVWNNINPLGANGTAFVTALAAQAAGVFDFTDRNNFGVWFADRLARTRSQDVNLVTVARGNSAIALWSPSEVTYPMLSETTAVWAASGLAAADIFLWHQGEANTGTSYASYSASFLAIVANLKAAGVLSNNTIIILGGLSEDNSARINFNNDVLKVIANNNAQIWYAPSDGLVSFDGTHFDGPSLYTLGAARYFAAYAEALGVSMADIFALVNEGGTPGSPGSGANKLYNLIDLALLGLRSKNVTLPPDFLGVLPVNNLMTAAMLAAGAITEYGVDPTNGGYVRFESGLQFCWNGLTANYNSTSILQVTWTFAKAFNARARVIMVPSSSPDIVGANPLPTAKRGGVMPDVSPNSGGGTCNLRLLSNGAFVATETWGCSAFAVGFYK